MGAVLLARQRPALARPSQSKPDAIPIRIARSRQPFRKTYSRAAPFLMSSDVFGICLAAGRDRKSPHAIAADPIMRRVQM
jgi:hypothetical protein